MIPLRGEYARLSAEMDGHRFEWEDEEEPDIRWYHYVLYFVPVCILLVIAAIKNRQNIK